jgi:hypothetical protein
VSIAGEAAADERQRQVVMRVQVRVAQPGAEQKQRVIEKRAVTIGRRLQRLQERCKELRLIRVHLGVARHLIRVVAMMRQAVMPFGDADLRIGAEIQLATEHESRHARDVGLERQPLQLEHQRDVMVESLRDADRPLEIG